MKKQKLKFTASKQVLIDPANFHTATILAMNRNQKAYGDLYGPMEKEKEEWALDPNVESELHSVSEDLILRVLKRAHLLAMYRTHTTPETFKKAKVCLTAEDMDVAIKTIEMDASL
jgi:hypothetical protein